MRLIAEVVINVNTRARIHGIRPGRVNDRCAADFVIRLRVIARDGVVKLQCIRCPRSDKRAVLKDCSPLCTAGALVDMLPGVIMRDNLNLSVHNTETSRPFPDVTIQITNSGGCSVMIPRSGAASGRCPPFTNCAVIVVCVRHDAPLMGRGMVAAKIVIPPGHESIFQAPQGNPRIFRICGKVPSLALRFAVLLRLIERHISARVFVGEAVRPVVHDNVRVLREVNLGIGNIIHNKHGMRRVRGPCEHAEARELRNPYHDRREALAPCPEVVIK